jgi:hypothetical protein
METTENGQSTQSYYEPTASAPESSLGEPIDSTEPAVLVPAAIEEQEQHESPNRHQDLFELCAKLVDNTDQLDKLQSLQVVSGCPGSLETAIQRALSRTSELLDILKRIATEEDQKSQVHGNTSVSQHPCSRPHHGLSNNSDQESALTSSKWAESSPSHPDISLATTLVTSYLLIVRYWRKVLLNINRLHFGSARSSNNTLPIMPTLLFGGVQVSTNLDIQVMVLLGTCSSMIQVIEAYLGVTSSSVIKFLETVIEAQTLALMDPISISLREMMLSHEVLRNIKYDGENTLMEVMESMRQHISRRGQI